MLFQLTAKIGNMVNVTPFACPKEILLVRSAHQYIDSCGISDA